MAVGYKIAEKLVTVAAAGTAVAIEPTDQKWTPALIITADSGNTGNIYVGPSTTDSTKGQPLAPDGSLEITGPELRGVTWELDLKTIFIDADTNGNKARVTFLQPSN